MSNQNNNDNGGMGCLLWFISFISDIIHNRRIKKYNKAARGLEEYKSITTDVLFPVDSFQENTLISGGIPTERLKFSERIIQNCCSYDRPTIILHLANSGLEGIVASNGGIVVNRANKAFDAFTSFDLQEINQVVFDTCKSKYELKPPGRYILQIVYDLLTARKTRPYFANFVKCPYHKLSEKINDAFSSGAITQDEADNLNSLLMMGQAECAKIDAFFNDMQTQLSHIVADNPNKTGGSSVLSAIKQNKILCIDLNSSANTMLVELIANSLIIAMNRGYEFTLFLDDVPLLNELLKNVFCNKASHNNVICTKDLYALSSGKDDIFSIIVGETEKTVLLSHGSHISCERWAKFFGEYDKIDVSHNRNSGFGDSGNWSFNTNTGQQTQEKREYKIKPEQINRLQPGEIFIYDNQNGSLIQTRVEI
jgi:hypothetical protein